MNAEEFHHITPTRSLGACFLFCVLCVRLCAPAMRFWVMADEFIPL